MQDMKSLLSQPQKKWQDSSLMNTQASNEDNIYEHYYEENKLFFNYLWVKMAELYPNWWAQYYGKRPSHTWLKIFKQLTKQQIKNGLNELSKPGSKFLGTPPAPLQFRELCLIKQELTAIEVNEIEKRQREIEANFNRAHDLRMLEYKKILSERSINFSKEVNHETRKAA
jgi:hypothetical protein